MLNKAHDDSNASPGAGQRPEDNAGGADLGMLGYTVVPFPAQKPAQANSDVSITADFAFTEVNQGTSITAYDEQTPTVSSETGK
jgi:hypothetical protein